MFMYYTVIYYSSKKVYRYFSEQFSGHFKVDLLFCSLFIDH